MEPTITDSLILENLYKKRGSSKIVSPLACFLDI